MYSSLDIDLSDSFLAYLQRKDENKEFIKDKRKTIAYKRKRKYANNSKMMEDIVEAKVTQRNNLRTYQSGVGVQTTTSHKKYNNEPVVRNGLCACGSKTHICRSSKLCSQRHWSKEQMTEYDNLNCTK